MNNDFDWNRLYASLPLQHLLSELEPQDKGAYYLLKCPSCGHHEAFLYKDNPSKITCNRKNKCGAETKVWDYIHSREHHETGRQTLEFLCAKAGIASPAVGKSVETPPEEILKRNLLEDFWRMCRDALPGSDSERYAHTRGFLKLERFGHFPGYKVTLERMMDRGYSAEELEEVIEFVKVRENHNLVFPIRNPHGEIISFVGRCIQEGVQGGKYLPFKPYKKDGFFNLPEALRKSRTELVVVEGYLDAIALDSQGIPAVAAASNNIPRKNLEGAMEAGVRRFILALDIDEAGKTGTAKGIAAIQSLGGEVFVIPAFGGSKDPAEWLGKSLSNPFPKAMKEAIPGWQFLLEHLVGSPETTLGLQGAIEKALEIYASISSPAERELANPIFAEKLGISQETFLEELRKQLQDDAGAIAKDKSLNWEEKHTQLLEILGYNVKLNALGKRVEVNGEGMDDFLFSKIYVSMKNTGSIGKDDLYMLLQHVAYQNPYNPVKEYFESLPAAPDGAIKKFCNYVHTEDNIFFHTIFRKFLIAAVARVYEQVEPPMLVLTGGQGIGKSRLASWLCPDSKYFHSGPIRPDKNDDQILLGKTFLWEVAELSATTKKADRDALKFFLTLPVVEVRKPYGRESLQIKPITSFIGTVNDFTGFLDDPTGSRRFHISEVFYIDFAYSKEMKVDQVWAEAYNAYNSGENWVLTPEEARIRDRVNGKYEVRGFIADLVHAHVYKVDPKSFISSGELYKHVLEEGYKGSDKKAYEEIKKAMIQAGCKEWRNSNSRGYLGCSWR